MGALPYLSKDDVNHCILVLTGVCLIGTVLAFASLFIVSSIKRWGRWRHRRDQRSIKPYSSDRAVIERTRLATALLLPLLHPFLPSQSPYHLLTSKLTSSNFNINNNPPFRNQVSIKIGEEIEYIDDRNTNVVSSAVQIASIHDSPAPANLWII